MPQPLALSFKQPLQNRETSVNTQNQNNQQQSQQQPILQIQTVHILKARDMRKGDIPQIEIAKFTTNNINSKIFPSPQNQFQFFELQNVSGTAQNIYLINTKNEQNSHQEQCKQVSFAFEGVSQDVGSAHAQDQEYSYRDNKKNEFIDLPQNSLSGVLLNYAQTVLDHLSQHTVAVLMPSLAGVFLHALLACTARFLLQGQISDGCIRDIRVRQHDQKQTQSSAFDGINANSSSPNGVIQSNGIDSYIVQPLKGLQYLVNDIKYILADWALLASGIKKIYVHYGGNEILFHEILNSLIEETADALRKGMNQQQIEDNQNQQNQSNSPFRSSSQIHVPLIHFSPQTHNTTFDGEYSSPAVTSWPFSMSQCSPGPIDEELLPVIFELVYGANSLIGMESKERRCDQRYNMKFLRLENMEKKELSDTEERRKKSGQIMQKGQSNVNRMQRDSLKRNQQDDNSEDDDLDDLSESVAEDTQEAVDWQIAMKGKENVNWIHPLNMSGRYKYRKEEPFEFQMHIEQVKSAVQNLQMWR
ncbi:MAG: hypothetical protein EZS28_007390 [Streblomastix strix]|uniref:Uncharacterized protein n=1 Tax=Streblomastix strix TaxID=222440 RepID=A0A5J4WQ22_9EUKA|nr:MAG: hypothetical protein EZS28_007390 [Streblomastix strix]